MNVISYLKRFVVALFVLAGVAGAFVLTERFNVRPASMDDAQLPWERNDLLDSLLFPLPKTPTDGEPRDASVQYNLGDQYYYGNGVPQDYAEAVKWYRKAADQGHAMAQNNLGISYDNGQGVPQDYAEAAKWYRKAADQGHARAQNNLGISYANGQGVPQDYSEAVKWYRKAADQGHADAQNSLGFRYGKGQGVPQDYVMAHMWYNLAASKGHDLAAKNRDIIAKRLTPEQIAEAQKLAREWKPNSGR